MPTITYQGTQYELLENETVLSCLKRHHVTYPHACQSGVCQSCLAKLSDGEMDPNWQKGLKDNLKAQDYFLPCITKPTTNITFSQPKTNDVNVTAQIISKDWLTHNVLQLKLRAEHLNQWIPGQYLNLVTPDNIIRSYSIANIPEDDGFIELHIKIRPDGLMGQWLVNKANANDNVIIRGPVGDCFYVNLEQTTFDMLLVGTGTGLAPLIGIAKSALKAKHNGKIILLHGGVTDSDLYCVDKLTLLSEQYENFFYYNSVLQSRGKYREAPIDDLMLEHLSQLKSTRVYACGPEDTTKNLKKKAFLAGVASRHIFSDLFI